METGLIMYIAREIKRRALFKRWTTLAFIVAACASPTPEAATSQDVRTASDDQTVAPIGRIPVRVNVPRAGYVSVVIENEDGERVRNLVSNQFMRAGEQDIPWDGYGIGEGTNYRKNGMGTQYDIVRSPVQPGTYTVRGILHDSIDLEFRGSIYGEGNPPWITQDSTGGWLSDHAPPVDVLFLPTGSPYGKEAQIVVSAEIAEAGHSYAWLNLDGRKLYGYREGWNGGLALAAGSGPNDPTHLYSLVQTEKAWLIRGHADTGRIAPLFRKSGVLAAGKLLPDLVVHEGTAVVSNPSAGELLLIRLDSNPRSANLAARIPIESPTGLAVSEEGDLLVITPRRVERFRMDWEKATASRTSAFEHHLAEPQRLLAADGQIFVSDWGANQVVRFSADGVVQGLIGRAGRLTSGRYEPTQMDHPAGMAWDGSRLWVAEASDIVRRLSVWGVDGTFQRAFYGSPKYGGGGVIDPVQPGRVFYAVLEDKRQTKAGIGFTVDPASGTSRPDFVYLLPDDPGDWQSLPSAGPEQPVHIAGKTYVLNNFNRTPAGQTPVAGIWLLGPDLRAHLVAAVGVTGNRGQQRWPAVERLIGGSGSGQLFAWSDLNLDGMVQAREVRSRPYAGTPPSVYLHNDLSVRTSAFERLTAPEIRDDGVPLFDLSTLVKEPIESRIDGDVLQTSDGWTILAAGPIVGVRDGRILWRYDNQWYGRGQASGLSTDGRLAQSSRMIGYSFPAGTMELWALNNDVGGVYLMTSDGFFVSQLGGDYRAVPKAGSLPASGRTRPADSFSFDWETFWPTISYVPADRSAYLVAGKEHSSIWLIRGTDSLVRLEPDTIRVTAEQLDGLPARRIERSDDHVVDR